MGENDTVVVLGETGSGKTTRESQFAKEGHSGRRRRGEGREKENFSRWIFFLAVVFSLSLLLFSIFPRVVA